VLSQIDRTNEAIYNATGRLPVTMRPPYGNLYPRQRLMLHQTRGMPTVLWSVDPEDWRRPGSVVANRIVSQSHPGAVVLAHDIHGPTIRAMPAAVSGLHARGFRFRHRVRADRLAPLGPAARADRGARSAQLTVRPPRPSRYCWHDCPVSAKLSPIGTQ
jgi:peptidoglycan/xylan/chitin deacetylase (PgdA/CDA1 family)